MIFKLIFSRHYTAKYLASSLFHREAIMATGNVHLPQSTNDPIVLRYMMNGKT